jgi:hypothetical protein
LIGRIDEAATGGVIVAEDGFTAITVRPARALFGIR